MGDKKTMFLSGGGALSCGTLDKEALENALCFLDPEAEEGDVVWGEHLNGADSPPSSGCTVEYLRWRLRKVIENFVFRLICLLLIITDICVLIADLATASYPSRTSEQNYIFMVTGLVFSCIFVVEVCIRIFVLRPSVFFVQWFNVVDFAVIMISFILCITDVILRDQKTLATNFRFIVVLRLVRLVRFLRIYTEKKNVEKGARQLVSQNKRRYQKDGFDLDLTYVTERVIAMSFPSSGHMSLYRNPIKEVVRFFNTKHPNHYRIYNLCSERKYNPALFGGRVERYLIDDHNVPTILDMLRFASSVKDWLNADKDNVIAVHCKGGKGRTGTMICVLLVDTGAIKNAKDSLDFFGNRRTDLKVGKKFQGVETPSQSRFVEYFEKVKKNGSKIPEKKVLIISKIIITGISTVGKGNGSDFSVEIRQGKDKIVFVADFGNFRNCQPFYEPGRDQLEVGLINCPPLVDEIRVLFNSSSNKVPKYYEDAPFYCWFHTSFIEQHKLVLTREELDNPHKPKTWNIYTEKFGVTFIFRDPS